MVDTLHIRLDLPAIKGQHSLDVMEVNIVSGQPASTVMARWADTGEAVQFHRVQYQPENKLYHIDSFNGYIYVQLHLPKWKSRGGPNVWPATKEEARQIFQELSANLDSIGIVTDLFKAVVVRLDIFANGATEYSYQDFKPVLDVLTIPRRTRVVYPDSIRFESARRVDIIYDKRAQQTAAGYSVADLPPNLVRWEYRLMKQDAVRSVTGVEALEDLFTNWDAIREIYIGNLKAALKYDETLAGQVMLREDIANLVRDRARVKQALYSKMVIDQVGSLEGVKTMLKQSGATRLQVYRQVMAIAEGLTYPMAGEGVPLNDLKVELYSKLIEGI